MSRPRGRPPSTRGPAAVRMALDGATVPEIAKELECAPATVARLLWQARKAGAEIPKGQTGRPVSERGPVAVRMAMDGSGLAEIAKELECAPATVSWLLWRARKAGAAIPKARCGPKGPHGWREAPLSAAADAARPVEDVPAGTV